MHQNLRANVGRVWFAGEATSAEYYGFLHGASRVLSVYVPVQQSNCEIRLGSKVKKQVEKLLLVCAANNVSCRILIRFYMGLRELMSTTLQMVR